MKKTKTPRSKMWSKDDRFRKNFWLACQLRDQFLWTKVVCLDDDCRCIDYVIVATEKPSSITEE